MANYTKQERALIFTARILMVAYLVFALLFALLPDYTLNYITDIGRVVFNWRSPGVAENNVQFWLMPAVSFLLSFSYICALVQNDPAQNLEYVRLILISTLVSSIGFAISLYSISWQFFFFIGAIINGTIFIITIALYLGASRSRNRWTLHD